MISAVKRVLIGRDRSSELYECRNCGEGVLEDTEICPQCGSREISYYELD